MLSEKHVMDRCRDCVYLIETKDGSWECHCDFDIKKCIDISDEECPVYRED